MPTNRPFFSNFLAAFRAHSNPTFKAASSNPSSPSNSPTGLAATAHVSTTTTNATSSPSNPRSITTKATNAASQSPTSPSLTSAQSAAAAAISAAAAAASTHLHSSPLSRSPGVSTPLGPHNMSISPPGASAPINRGRQRRGSDSSNSSGGFNDALGAEKWYIGGRTAGGDEKFYRLAMVTGAPGRRVRSLDRLSL